MNSKLGCQADSQLARDLLELLITANLTTLQLMLLHAMYPIFR